MSFDRPVLIWCIGVPGLIALLSVLANVWLTRRARKSTSREGTLREGTLREGTSRAAEVVLSLGHWFAIAVAIYGMGHLQSDASFLWSEDSWPRMIGPVLIAALLSGIVLSTSVLPAGSVWILLTVVAVGTALLVMPTGEGWVDTLPLHRFWMAGIVTSTIANSFLLHVIFERGASRWLSLILLAQFACAAIIGASAYGALFEVCLAAVVATSVISMFSSVGWIEKSFAIVFASTLIAASMIAAGRFYSYAEITPVAYGGALFAPSIIAIADLFLFKFAAWIRVAVSAVLATVIVSSVAYWFLVA